MTLGRFLLWACDGCIYPTSIAPESLQTLTLGCTCIHDFLNQCKIHTCDAQSAYIEYCYTCYTYIDGYTQYTNMMHILTRFSKVLVSRYVVVGTYSGLGICYMQLLASRNRSSKVPSLENIQNTQLLMLYGPKTSIFQKEKLTAKKEQNKKKNKVLVDICYPM